MLIPLDLPLTHAFSVTPTGPTTGPPPRPPTAVDSSAELILLQPPQVANPNSAWARSFLWGDDISSSEGGPVHVWVLSEWLHTCPVVLPPKCQCI